MYVCSSKVVNFLRVNDDHIEVSDILGLTVSFKFTNFSFQILPIFVHEMPVSFRTYIV